MDEQTFWELVDRIGHDPADYDRLADELSDHGAADIRDFADHLARALHALDTPAHYRAAATSGMSFLGVRCAVVAAGATAYQRVLSMPGALASYAGRSGAQLLLPVAERAFRTATRTDWRHQTVVSTRTGANEAAWGDSWLHPHMGATADGRAPRDYMVALRHVALTLDADPAWRSWWRRSGLRACELGIVAEGEFDHLRPSADLQRFDDRLKANFTCSLPTSAETDLAARAVAEVRAMFEVIRQAMSMPALPPTPPVPALPADLPEVSVTTRALPATPQESEPQGYLTLTQIQEFFG